MAATPQGTSGLQSGNNDQKRHPGEAKLRKWLAISLPLVVAPFILKTLLLAGAGRWSLMQTIFSDGELLLVTCALSGEVLGELITAASSEDIESRRVLLLGLASISSLFAAVFYGVVTVQTMSGGIATSPGTTPGNVIVLNPTFVSVASMVLFVPVVVATGYVKLNMD